MYGSDLISLCHLELQMFLFFRAADFSGGEGFIPFSRFFFACFIGGMLAGCTTSGDENLDLIEPNTSSSSGFLKQPLRPRSTISGGGGIAQDQTVYYFGSGQMVGAGAAAVLDPQIAAGAPVTLNLANASIESAAKAVMGDALGLNYSVASGLRGSVTIQTAQPVARGELVKLFQDALAANGAAIIRTGKVYRIDSLEQARNAISSIEVGTARSGGEQIGAGVRVVPLRYIAASEMRRILEPMAGRAVVLGADDARNTLTLSGNSQEIGAVLETISVFDVDVMQGMSFAVVPVKSARPDALADELAAVFGSGGSKGMVRFLPNNRMRSILVASAQRSYLTRAETWIRRLDSRAQGHEKQLFTYKVQNRSAKELVSIINGMFSKNQPTANQDERNVAPRLEETSLQTRGTDVAVKGVPTPEQTPQSPGADFGAVVSEDERVRVTADISNNSLLTLATPADYNRVLAIIQDLDVSPRQVLIEATIAEVALNDELKFGVRWYLNGKNSNYMFTDSATKSFASVFPGFSYALQAPDVQVAVDALNKVTQVNIVSAPSLMVLDNRTATLQIGDQVPIVTQSAASVQGSNAPIINSVDYRDTGVILKITPRINDSGRVLLDIAQEVSSVTSTISSGIDSPTIKQRKVATSVMVDDGQVIALGGIIQNQRDKGATKIPILGDIPLLGNAFKSKSGKINKTELIILIKPRVVRDAREAQEATDEYRRKIGVSTKVLRGGVRNPVIGETIKRVIE